MSYTVLARKYRSKTFDDLVGQEAIATTLKNAITSDRVHHGYLFTGTRGVGKTSSARVLAKALNCLESDGPTAKPCCACESCLRVAEGEDIDVIEIDAASNTGVDNIRDLRDNAAYRPARSRFKIYIIDEVHMLSTGAFNALLKTLEEPPDHVKFILATTEIHKVPATIVSRCQRFDFRSIGVEDIAGHLTSVLKKENVEADETVVRRVARLANGSMRDGLSLLDQLLSYGGGRLAPEIIEEVLPAAHDETVARMMAHVADEDAAAALACVEESLGAGQTIDRFCESVITHLRTLMLLNLCGADTEMVDVPVAARDEMASLSARFDGATYTYMISMLEEVRRSVRSSNASRALLDAAVVRLALSRNFSQIDALLDQIESAAPSDAPAAAQPKPNATPAVARKPTPAEPAKAPRASARRPAAPARNRETAQPSRQPSRPRATSGVSSADKSRIGGDPRVQKAIELFDGSLYNVERTPQTTPPPSDD